MITHQKPGHPDLLYWVFSLSGYHRQYLYVYYRCKFATQVHLMCVQ